MRFWIRIGAWLILSSTLWMLGGCASDPYMLAITDESGNVDGAAYGAHDFTFRKAMPDRRDYKPWEFYYKHCSESGDRTYFSKTSYDCNGPYY